MREADRALKQILHDYTVRMSELGGSRPRGDFSVDVPEFVRASVYTILKHTSGVCFCWAEGWRHISSVKMSSLKKTQILWRGERPSRVKIKPWPLSLQT